MIGNRPWTRSMRSAPTAGRAGHLAAGAAALITTGVLITACSSGTNNAAVNSGATVGNASPATSSVSSDTSSSSAGTSGAASTTASSTPAPAPVSHLPVQRSTCASLSIRVLRGSASAGQEIAALQFTNSGTSSCVLAGYPTVSLLVGGKQIGQSSQPSTTAVSRWTLAPGAVAESRLHDYTSCQAPLSDSIKVIAPGSTITSLRPIALRACILRVDKLSAPQ